MTTDTETTPEPRVTVSTWIGFGLMCLGMFMAILDIQIVATSLPTIQRALDIAPDQMSWIQTAYLIAEVVAILLTGFLTRWLTLRRLFVIGVTAFTFASAGCALSNGFESLIAWRILQGFAGGVLIPTVFSAVFLLFPMARVGLATMIAGVLAVLAPTIGPIIGGWVTETYSWHWLFLINIVPGIIVAIGTWRFLPRDIVSRGLWRTLDVLTLMLIVASLAALMIGLKEAPGRGWVSIPVLALLALSAVSGLIFVLRCLKRDVPIVQLRTLRDRNFAIGCGLSFALGIGLFGATYLMPVFLAFVRGHEALRIGEIMLVTGAAQLVTAPIAVWLERKTDPRILAGLGFLVFSIGIAMSAFQTAETDFAEMLVPQLVRGVAIMFCLLPPTRLALGYLDAKDVPDASGLFNLMRNLGGAIGIALIDTVIYGRAPHHVTAIIADLKAGNLDTARAVGIPDGMITGPMTTDPTPEMVALVQPMVTKLSLVYAINEAWAMIAALTLLALLCIPWTRAVKTGSPPPSAH